jgi:hypothetical protein
VVVVRASEGGGVKRKRSCGCLHVIVIDGMTGFDP